MKEASKDAAEVSSLPLMSVDEAGVGGRPGRGMAVADEVSDRVLPECNDGGREFKAVTRLDSKQTVLYDTDTMLSVRCFWVCRRDAVEVEGENWG